MAEETIFRRMHADRKKTGGKKGFDEADVAQGKHKQPGKPCGPNEVNVTKLSQVLNSGHAVWDPKTEIIRMAE